MSKELEYIQRQINIVKQQVKGSKMKIIVTDTVTKHQYDYYERELQTLESIEKSLQRLEAIDNAEPSEALKKLQNLRLYQCGACEHHHCSKCDVYKDFNAVNKYILKAQKEHKALEIIKEKPQAELSLIQLGKIKTYEEYLNYTNYWELDLYGDMVYTEEEFNLLKEMLE